MKSNYNQAILVQNEEEISLAKPKVIAFDLDLTLHDIISHYDDSVNETLRHFGHDYLTKEEMKQVGDNFTTTEGIFVRFLPKEQLEDAVIYYLNHFLEREIPPNAILPGAHELLYLLKTRLNIPIIGVTNADEGMAIKILKDLNVFRWFDHVIGTKEGVASKPDPQMLLVALESINYKPGPHVWVVGDRATDTLCAKNSNCTAIRFYHIIKPKDNNADLFINNHYNLFGLIESKVK